MKIKLHHWVFGFTLFFAAPVWTVSGPQSMARFLPAGTTVWLRTNEAIDLAHSRDGQTYMAEVHSDVKDKQGALVIPKGSAARLVVRKKMDGTVVLELNSLSIQHHLYGVETGGIDAGRQDTSGSGTVQRPTGVKGGMALGTLLGMITAGGQGAARGALGGATAGGVLQQLSKAKNSTIPPQSLLQYHLDQPLRIPTSK